MSENKMLAAYSHFLDQAKQFAKKAENITWDTLLKGVDTAEQDISEINVLTEQELAQVQEDVKADIVQVADYLNDSEQGAKEFIDMDIPILEQYLEEQALKLADPTTITLLRMRLAAALDHKQKNHHHKD